VVRGKDRSNLSGQELVARCQDGQGSTVCL
jgi:hypothetical protein